MVRYRKRTALYEVIGKSSLKPSSSDTTKQDVQESENDVKAEPVDVVSAWPRKPRVVQLNAGRVEFSVPYQLVIGVLLGVVLVVLVAFWLGQNKGAGTAAETTVAKTDGRAKRVVRKSVAESGRLKSKADIKTVVSGAADNRIVIQTLKSRRALEPVKEYFAGAGIETEIRKIGDTYYLVSKQRYGNPDRKGTEGYAAKEKIKQIGAKYEAPSGYASFGTKPFQDAYGKKFGD